MPELEIALRTLGREVEFPPAPDLVPGVRRRLGERRARLPRQSVAIALAVLVVALGAVLAVPPARTAILEWLGIKGVKITRVEDLPPTPVAGNLRLGREVSLTDARRLAPWLQVPSDAPDSVYFGRIVPGGQVSMVWGSPSSPRLLLTEFQGIAFIEKLVQPETEVEPVDVAGSPGAWLSGPEHVLLYRDIRGATRENTARLVGNTLVWQFGDVTLRLEGDLAKDEALRIARSVH